ncbi:hypothetical protein DAI22_02g030000 [Oryza sativa Japonica Group]|uniref:Reverse transcriptase zinc-binding domain-containing protein n=2 Tax=Oryza TaxID=4527 RepID=Q6Z0Y1_ORYSJ|nr:hypothetical protein DAI22_02g030000 [Oryza sativa Japonica Group]BAD10370.1 hypothetical protein [Oryza sativa Japonica Group]
MTPWMDEWGRRLSARRRSGDGEESAEEARWMPGAVEGAAERGIEPSRARDRGGCEERGEVGDSGGGEGMCVSANSTHSEALDIWIQWVPLRREGVGIAKKAELHQLVYHSFGKISLNLGLWRVRRGLATSACYPFCPIDEDVEHLFLSCSGVAAIWHSYGLDEQQVASLAHLEDLWGLPPPDNALTPRIWRTILLAAVWNIWKRHNNKIFNSIDEAHSVVLHRCANDIELWSNRCNDVVGKQQLHSWALNLSVINH